MDQTSRSRVIFHTRLAGHPFGVYAWRRRSKTGVVFRIGPVGHIQFQMYRYQTIGERSENRRKRHGFAVHFWGVRGRRRKRGIELNAIF